jgi:hypothetical protein
MAQNPKTIANLKMEINREDLKKIVESGKLTEFVENAAAVAAEEIRIKIFDELGKQALSAGTSDKALNTSISISVGFLELDDKYGTHCKAGPFCKRAQDMTQIGSISTIVASGVAAGVIKGMTQYDKTTTE